MRTFLASTSVCLITLVLSTCCVAQSLTNLDWNPLPPIPDELGLAGPIVGIHDDILIVGGGANFSKPVWDNDKEWRSTLYALDLRQADHAWQNCGPMPSALAYCACASTAYGVVALGGNDDLHELKQCWLFSAERKNDRHIALQMTKLPDLPKPVVYGQAAWTNGSLVLLTGQTGKDLSTAIAGGWQLEIKPKALTGGHWQGIEACPGGPRAFAMLSTMPGREGNGKLLLMGGRHQVTGEVKFLQDVWRYTVDQRAWERLADLPVPVSAGGACPLGDNLVAVLSGDDGSLFSQTDKLRDDHPGFAKRTWLYDVATSHWQAGNPSPANQVTTTPVSFGQRIVIATGEIRPRVRTNQVWVIESAKAQP